MNTFPRILCEQLQRYGHGDALWCPEPGQNETEVQLGDVGIIDQEGSFYRLFNAMAEENDPLNKGGVPEGFVPLKLNSRLRAFRPECHAPGPLTSSSVKHTAAKGKAGANFGNVAGGGLMYQFACSSGSGAWLLLKDFSDKTYIRDTEQTTKYMLQHYDSWYQFAESVVGLDCKKYDIILVKGFVKTSAWYVAAYKSGMRSAQAMSVTGTLGGVAEAGVEFRVLNSEGYLFDKRFGPPGRDVPSPLLPPPSPRPSFMSEKGKGRASADETELSAFPDGPKPTPLPRDQSVFLSYYKLKNRPILGRKIVANAGPHELPPAPDKDQNTTVVVSDSEESESIEEVPGRQRQHLPIDDLLEYIVNNSEAEAAIASHDDIANLFADQPWPDDFAEWLNEHQPQITVTDSKSLGYLSIQNSVIRNRTQILLNAVSRQDEVEQEEQNKQAAIAAALEEERQERQRQAREAAPEGDTQPDSKDARAPEGQLQASTSEEQPAQTVQVAEQAVENATVAVGMTVAADGSPDTSGISEERHPGSRSITQGRQYGSSVELDGKVYLGSRSEERTLRYPHMVLADRAADGCAITAIALSASTNRVASTCEDRAIRVWDLATGALIMKLDGHRDSAYAVAFSPDGGKLVSGGADHKAIVWNLDNHSQIAHLYGHTGDVWICDYSPDGRYIATGSTDCMAKLWDGQSGRPLLTLQDHVAIVMTVSFSPDSEQLLTCADNIGCLWSTENGSLLARMTAHTGLIWSAKFSMDGTRIVTAAEDHTARVWSVQNGEELVILAEHSAPVWTASFSPDGNDVVTGSYDGQVFVCDSYTGERKHQFVDDRPSFVSCVQYSKDGDFIVAGYADGAVKLWNARDGQLVAEFMGHDDKVKDVHFSPDDCHVVSCSDDSTVRIWNIVDMLQL